MESAKTDALDEIVWRAPEIVQELGGIHTNTVLFYFARSPFFDATSNNNVIFTQAMNNQNLFPYITTRVLFEQRLREMQGLEFVVMQDPSEGDTKQIHSGIWVIRKQNRKKMPGKQDEITPLSAYFIMGENIYMAPSLGNILTSRILSTLSCLSNFLSTARPLSDFTPAIGHTYLPPISKQTTPASSFQATQASIPSTPLPSGSTPLPNTATTTSNTQTSQQKSPTSTDTNTAYTSTRLFAEAWDMNLKYGNDYMDDNPLLGEPGNFRQSKPSKDVSLQSSMASTSTTTANIAQPFKAVTKKPAAPPIKTDIPLEKDGGGGGGKKGTTPGTAKSPNTPGGFKDKKGRRKSKAAGVATPKVQTPKTGTPS